MPKGTEHREQELEEHFGLAGNDKEIEVEVVILLGEKSLASGGSGDLRIVESFQCCLYMASWALLRRSIRYTLGSLQPHLWLLVASDDVL